MLSACNMRMETRLALLPRDGGTKALLFEAPRTGGAGATSPQPSCSGRLVAAAMDAGADVVASSLPLQNTLLAAAADRSQARFISDVGSVMQVRGLSGVEAGCARPTS
jgi:hypothetical protein